MYNEERKQSYIDSKSRTYSSIQMRKSVFKQTEKYEIEFNKDICEFNNSEITILLNNMFGIRSRSRTWSLTILKDYIRWCIISNIPNTNQSLLSAQTIGSDKIKETMVSCPTHLQKCLDILFDKEDEDTVDCIYRCYCWMAFSGISEDDVLKVKSNDIDFIRQNIIVNGKNYPLYRDGIKSFINASRLTEFIYKNAAYSKKITVNRVPGDELIRGIRAVPSLQTIRTEISRTNKNAIDAGKEKNIVKLSYYRLWLSGIFYREYDNERSGYNVDFEKYAKEFVSGKTYKLDSCRSSIDNKSRQIYNEYLNDYECWKAAFFI